MSYRCLKNVIQHPKGNPNIPNVNIWRLKNNPNSNTLQVLSCVSCSTGKYCSSPLNHTMTVRMKLELELTGTYRN